MPMERNKWKKKAFTSLSVCLFWVHLVFGADPLPFYGADPEPLVGPDGRMYIFPTNSGPDGAAVRDWHVYSSVNLVDWTDHGRILSVDQVSWARAKAWAPAAAYRNGTFYFYYYFFDADPRASVGVASSSTGRPPYTNRTPDKPLVSGLHDPAVFIDDDGQAYLFNSAKFIRLNPDMISVSGRFMPFTYEPAPFSTREEGAYVFKRGDLYYMTQSPKADPNSSDRAEAVVYYTSRAFAGPWRYRGVLIEPQPGQTRHASICRFRDRYIIWYHHLVNGVFSRRRPCAQYVRFNPDGTIQKVDLAAPGVQDQPLVGGQQNRDGHEP